MSGARHRRKGNRVEREIVEAHRALGSCRALSALRCEPVSWQRSRIDIYTFGREAAPLVAECKARGNGGGFVQLERWLGEYDLLFLRRDNADALVLAPWRVLARLLTRGRAT